MADPEETDPAQQGAPSAFDWSTQYASGETPWDLGGPHPELSARLQDGSLAPPFAGARALVPGAGRSHDALALARRGWNVTAVDLVEALESSIAPALARLGGRFVTADVLAFWPELETAADAQGDDPRPSPGFDLIWDHTFFCAIAPSDRARWGRHASELLAPGGRFAALVFPVGKPPEAGGPPHGMDEAAVAAALGPLCRTLESGPVHRPVARRTWREHWLLAEKARLAPAE